MIEQLDEFQIQMVLQLIVSCVKLWHHTEIHKLRQTTGSLQQKLSGVLRVEIGSRKKAKDQSDLMSANAMNIGVTYSDIQSSLYLFDLLDAMSLIGMCNKDKVVRNLSIVLMH